MRSYAFDLKSFENCAWSLERAGYVFNTFKIVAVIEDGQHCFKMVLKISECF